MKPYEKKILDARLPDFLEEVVPVDLLPYLPCLTKPDKEAIEARQNIKGSTRATDLLVDRLKRRNKAFEQFVLALRRCGSGHTALLLDPYCNIVETEDESADAKDESGLGFKKMGTAIDVSIRGNLLPLQDEMEHFDQYKELETFLAETYQDPLSNASKKMRTNIQKHLPAGAAFVHTAKGSIISTFRLSSVSAASQLWEMYSEGKLQSMLQEVLVDGTLKEGPKVPEEQLELKINLSEEEFKNIQQKLAAIESEQEIKESGSLLSFPRKEQGENADDDDEIASEIQIDIPPVYLENGNPLGRPELKLRDYQKELADPALQGKNTIICAPTNSGKTFVAIEIARNHLDSFSKDDETCAGQHNPKREPRVVFIVSTVNLVLQQKDRFELYLGDKYSVTEISGANQTEIPLKYLLLSHKVVIMTAQILVNALNSNNKDQRVQLSDISLLIFDECHHAQKDHSYNRVMETYMALRLQPGNQHKLPQIVGLTASLGTGKAKSVQKAEEHIILVCANLDAEVVSTVRKHESELRKHVNGPKSEVFQVAKNERDPFERIINQVMDKIHGGIKRLMNKFFKSPPLEKSGQQYRQWVEELYKDSIAAGDRYLVTYAEQLREYHIALTINTNTRMKNAKLHLQKYFELLDEDMFTETDRNLRELFCRAMNVLDRYVQENGEPQNPRLMRLKQLLLDNYKDFQIEDEIEEDDQNDKRTSEDKSSDQTVKENAQPDRKQDDIGNTEEQFRGTRENDEKCENENLKTNCGPFTVKEHAQEISSDLAQTIKDEEHAGSKEEAQSCPTEEQTVKEELHATKKDIGENNSDDSIDERQEINLAVKTNCSPKEKAGPKGILFTRTRESTEALLDWIKDTEELNSFLRPDALVGSGDGTIGMTPREQEKVIKRFQVGEKNILLATSVAEEGLDISDCNYVIRYDMMGNEISSVQSRGRVRAKVGKYSVVVSSESGARKREDTNRYRECLMVEALRKVQDMDSKTFIKTVKDKQSKVSLERNRKKNLLTSSKTVDLCNDVTLRCRKCNEVACQASDLRRVKEMYHVVINCDFKKSKVTIEPLSKPKTVDKILMAKKIFCSTCKEDWGVTAFIDGVEWMCIKVRSFVLEFKKGTQTRRMFKQWKEVPFAIPEATIEELLQQDTDQTAAEFQSDDFNLD